MTELGALSAQDFSSLMLACGPFEPHPRLAVGVSGGADSLALSLLLQDWVQARDGAFTALTVDHGLRPGSADEAMETGRILSARGIDHVILRWRHDGALHGIQAAARDARLQLLSNWCVEHGVFHLALAHHAGDQAETVVQRLWSGSGLDGLAAMAPVRELVHCRLLRPLIPVSPERLRATLESAGVPWLEDPSNDDSRFGRVQARRFLRTRAEPLRTRHAALEASQTLADWRSTLELGCAELASAACRLHPLGYAELDRARLLAAPRLLAERLLRGLFQAIGGTAYPMAEQDAEAAYAHLLGMPGQDGFTAGRCLMLPGEGERWLLCREARDLPDMLCEGPGPWLWDGRFLLRRREFEDRLPVRVAPGLLSQGCGGMAQHPLGSVERIHHHIRVNLPRVEESGGCRLSIEIEGAGLRPTAPEAPLIARFRPRQPAVPGPFTVA